MKEDPNKISFQLYMGGQHIRPYSSLGIERPTSIPLDLPTDPEDGTAET